MAHSVYQSLHISGQRAVVYCTNNTFTPGSEAYGVLQPDNHWLPCDLSPLCLFSPPCHYVKEDFLLCPYWFCFSYPSTSPGFVCARELRSICPSVVPCVLWLVHHPLWGGMHGWLTLTIQTFVTPRGGGGGCVCMLVCLCMSVCICSHTHSVWASHNMSVLKLYMTLEGAGVGLCPIVSGNPTLQLLISPLQETQLLIRPLNTCKVFMQNISWLFLFQTGNLSIAFKYNTEVPVLSLSISIACYFIH